MERRPARQKLNVRHNGIVDLKAIECNYPSGKSNQDRESDCLTSALQVSTTQQATERCLANERVQIKNSTKLIVKIICP